MSMLSDDELGLIFQSVYDPGDRKSVSLVCKQWLRVEGLTRSFLRVLEADSLRSFLPRYPNLIKFECAKPIADDDLKFLALTCPKIKTLKLNSKAPRDGSDAFDHPLGFDDVGDDGLCALAVEGCKLSKVSLRRRKNIGDIGVVSLVKMARNLTLLDLGWCNLITDQVLGAIGAVSCLHVLNLEGCSLITDRGLVSLATGALSRSLKKLVLQECDQISDYGVSYLQQMCCLEELNMAECGPKVTDIGCVAVAAIQTLRRVNLSWLINVSDPTLVALAENCPMLMVVDLTGCELITGDGLRAFADHGCLETLVFRHCNHICASAVVHLALRCHSLRFILLDKVLQMWIPEMVQKNISRFCDIQWR